MDKLTVKEYLAQIADIFEAQLHEAAIAETDEGAVLLMSADSPFDDGKELSYSVSLEDPGTGMMVFEVVIYAFDGISEDRFEELREVINALNARLDLGGFRLLEETGTVMLSQGFVIGGGTDAAAASRILINTIDLLENAAANAGIYIYDLLRGRYGAKDVIAELERIEEAGTK